MFRRRATVATIALVGTLVACSAPAPENDATSAAALTVVNPNDECYQNVTSTFWLNAAQASTTIDTRLVWYATSLTMPAGSGPVTSEPYVAFAGLVPQTASTNPGEAVALAWVPQDVATNFNVFNPICGPGAGSGVGTPTPSACLGSNLPVAWECIASVPAVGSTSGRDCQHVTYPGCITVGEVKALAADDSCSLYVDTFCN